MKKRTVHIVVIFATLLLLSLGNITAAQGSETYVLVHGAFQDATVWTDVVTALEGQGHTAIAIDLPGHGADDTPPGEITLVTYRDAVINVIEQQDQPVILVGHSFGGIVISEVAEAIPDQIDMLVYVAGYIPRPGDSLVSLAELDRQNGFNDNNFLLAEDFTYAHVLEEDVLTLFCGDCTEAQGERVLATMQNEPLTPLNEPATVTEAIFGRVRKAYIMTAQDNAASPQIQVLMLAYTPVDRIFALDTSHVPFITMPDQLTGMLLTILE